MYTLCSSVLMSSTIEIGLKKLCEGFKTNIREYPLLFNYYENLPYYGFIDGRADFKSLLHCFQSFTARTDTTN